MPPGWPRRSERARPRVGDRPTWCPVPTYYASYPTGDSLVCLMGLNLLVVTLAVTNLGQRASTTHSRMAFESEWLLLIARRPVTMVQVDVVDEALGRVVSRRVLGRLVGQILVRIVAER